MLLKVSQADRDRVRAEMESAGAQSPLANLFGGPMLILAVLNLLEGHCFCKHRNGYSSEYVISCFEISVIFDFLPVSFSNFL
jgi:hypothetical protein